MTTDKKTCVNHKKMKSEKVEGERMTAVGEDLIAFRGMTSDETGENRQNILSGKFSCEDKEIQDEAGTADAVEDY